MTNFMRLFGAYMLIINGSIFYENDFSMGKVQNEGCLAR